MMIRSEQVNAFREAMLARFEERAMAHLRQRFMATLSETDDDSLRQRVRAGTERAALYNVRAESDVLRYLEYTVEYGPDFDATAPWAVSILRADATGTAKMDALDDWTTFSLRQ